MPGSPSSVSAVSRPALRGGELLSDRAELDLPPNHGPGGPSNLKGKRHQLGAWRAGRHLRVVHSSNLRAIVESWDARRLRYPATGLEGLVSGG